MHEKTGLQALGGLVYSTDAGRLCPGCEQPVAQCRCADQAIPEGDGIARVRRETKGRGGKTVTTVTGVLLNADDLKALAKRLKNRCGCGGAVKDGIIEIQGDKVDQVCELLVAEGFKVKRAGG